MSPRRRLDAIALAKQLARTRQPAGMRTRLAYRGFSIDVENQSRNIRVIPVGAGSYPEHLGALRVAVNDTDHYVLAPDELVYSDGVPYSARVRIFFATPAGETEVDMSGFPPIYLSSTNSGSLDYWRPSGFRYLAPGADRLSLVAGTEVIGVPSLNGLYVTSFGVLHNGVFTIAAPEPPPPGVEWTELSTRLRGLSPGPVPGSAVAVFESLSTTPSTSGLLALSISPSGGAAYTEWRLLPQRYEASLLPLSTWFERTNISENVQVGWHPRYLGLRYADEGGPVISVAQYMADFYVVRGDLASGVVAVSIPFELVVGAVDEGLNNSPITICTERNSILVGASIIRRVGAQEKSRKLCTIDFYEADAEQGTEFRWAISDGPTVEYTAYDAYFALGDGRFGVTTYTPDTVLGGYSDVRLLTYNRTVPLLTVLCGRGIPVGSVVVGSGELVTYVQTFVTVHFASTEGGPIDNSYIKTTRLTLRYITDEEASTVADFENTDNGLVDVRALHLSPSSVVYIEASSLQFGIDAYRTYRRTITHFSFLTGEVTRVGAPLVSTEPLNRLEMLRVSDTSFIWTVQELSSAELGVSGGDRRGRFIHMFSCVVAGELITQEVGETYYTGYSGSALVASEVSPSVGVGFQSVGPVAGPATIVADNGVYQVYSKEATEISEDPEFRYYTLQLVGGPYEQAVEGFSARTVTRITKDLTYVWPGGLVDSNPLPPFVQRASLS